MKIITTREFRRNMASCMKVAEIETVYVKRPGNKVIQLSLLPQKDAHDIHARERM